jgi:hypothetical protein
MKSHPFLRRLRTIGLLVAGTVTLGNARLYFYFRLSAF